MLTLKTLSGIGDLSWLLNKIAAWQDRPEIHLNITSETCFDSRIADFCRLVLSYIVSAEVTTHRVKDVYVHSISFYMERFPIEGVWYASFNPQLEMGIRVEQIFPEMPIDYHYLLSFSDVDEETAIGIVEKLGVSLPICVLLESGAFSRGVVGLQCWSAVSWASLLTELYIRCKSIGFVLIGGVFDVKFICDVALILSERRVPFAAFIGNSITINLCVVKHCKYMLGSASGPTILSNVMYVPTYAWLPRQPALQRMSGTWGDPDDIIANKYRVVLVEPVEVALNWITNVGFPVAGF